MRHEPSKQRVQAKMTGLPKAIVLLSGGLDSATVLAIASREFDCHAISFDYRQRHLSELNAAKRVADAAGCGREGGAVGACDTAHVAA